LQSADAAKYVALKEIATNAEGSTEQVSNWIGPVLDLSSITILTPTLDEQKVAGGAFNVSATGGSGLYNIQFSKNGGISFSVRATGVAMPYVFIPADSEATEEAVVRVIDNSDPAIFDDSPQFKIATNNPPSTGSPRTRILKVI
jgi:hypothetical protein